MTQREDEAQAIVGDRRVVVVDVELRNVGDRALQAREQLEFLVAAAVAAQRIERAVACGGDDPRDGIARNAVLRPTLERRDVGFLNGVFGTGEIVQSAR